MDIRVLGCHGSQLPGLNTTSFLLNGHLLIDAGAVANVLNIEEQRRIDQVLVTHAHLDHIRDIAFLADNLCYGEQRHKPLTVRSTPFVLQMIHAHVFNGVIWPDFSILPSREKPVIRFKALVPGKTEWVGDLQIEAIKVDHTVETVGYVVRSAEGTVIFFGDTGVTEPLWERANGVDDLRAIFIETSLPDGMKVMASQTGHLTPALLKEELKKLCHPHPEVYLYHMKWDCHDVIREQIAAIGNHRIHFLTDGQRIRIDPR